MHGDSTGDSAKRPKVKIGYLLLSPHPLRSSLHHRPSSGSPGMNFYIFNISHCNLRNESKPSFNIFSPLPLFAFLPPLFFILSLYIWNSAKHTLAQRICRWLFSTFTTQTRKDKNTIHGNVIVTRYQKDFSFKLESLHDLGSCYIWPQE